jgi:peptide/nickel transport system ATP-binding protein
LGGPNRHLRFRTRCPLAQGLCALEEPPLRPFTAFGHLVACHFPLCEPTAGMQDAVIATGTSA